jgi:hypothetical protein
VGIKGSGEDRGQAYLLAGLEGPCAGCWEVVLYQVGDDRVAAFYRLLAEVPVGVADLLADLCPGARRRCPVAGVPLYVADQCITVKEIDQAVIGELWHEDLGRVL